MSIWWTSSTAAIRSCIFLVAHTAASQVFEKTAFLLIVRRNAQYKLFIWNNGINVFSCTCNTIGWITVSAVLTGCWRMRSDEKDSWLPLSTAADYYQIKAKFPGPNFPLPSSPEREMRHWFQACNSLHSCSWNFQVRYLLTHFVAFTLQRYNGHSTNLFNCRLTEAVEGMLQRTEAFITCCEEKSKVIRAQK